MFSIICVYNNREILDEYLMDSLSKQEIEYDLILVDNTTNIFASAAAALNSGAAQAKGDHLMFIHQDVRFQAGFLLELQGHVDMASVDSIFGVAGINPGEELISNVVHGNLLEFAGKIQIKKPVACQTVDEVLLIVPRDLFKHMAFDETTCNGWHLYAVDYCLSARLQGFKVFVLPVTLEHRSKGSVDSNYYKILGRVAQKHRNTVKTISTSIGSWPSQRVLLQVIFIKIRIKTMLQYVFPALAGR